MRRQQNLSSWVASGEWGSVVKKVLRFQRFPLKLKLVLLAPLASFLIFFKYFPNIPNDIKPEIDVKSLPRWEKIVLFGGDLQFWPRISLQEAQMEGAVYFLDILAALIYLAHYVVAWLFGAFLYWYYRKRTTHTVTQNPMSNITDNPTNTEGISSPVLQPWIFFWCLGWLCICGVTTQVFFPTAPPWYTARFGAAPASYDLEGDPAGLVMFDRYTNYPLFTNIYKSSPIVFGSFPSLHVAWPLLITLFIPRHTSNQGMYAGVVYTLMVSWAAIYLNHHWVVDILGAVVFVAVAYLFGVWSAVKLMELEWVKTSLKRRTKNLKKLITGSDDETSDIEQGHRDSNNAIGDGLVDVITTGNTTHTD
jgi:membrane-associated phospholipid phosphatase